VFGSFPIARVFGTTVRIDLSWVLLVIGTAALWPGDPLAAVINLLILFTLVTLHELGHTLAARYFKIEVLDITLWFLGGMARMREIPENPKIEAIVALAGLALPLLLASGIASMSDIAPNATATLAGLLANFILINLFMGASNLLPAFPMDGGRVFRAFCGVFTDWLNATRIAAGVGKLFAAGLIVLGFLSRQWSVAAVGLFVWLAGSRELWAVRMRRMQQQMREQTFGGFGERAATFTPVEPSEPAREASDEDPSGARRPGDNPLAQGKELDEEALRRLEQFRGSIRKPRDPEQ
jgi:stage IV sporulation protein FB